MPKKHGIIGRLFDYAWLLFLNGLLTLLPLAITIALFHFSFNLLKGWLVPLRQFKPDFLAHIPHAEILVVIAIIFAVGTILKIFVVRSIVHALEDIIETLPLIRPVYSGVKQLTKALSPESKVTFKTVVLVEFPRKGVYSLGFLTSEQSPTLMPHKEQALFGVFIPTTPNPTSGYFIMIPESDITVVSLTRQEAMALIISGGIIQPKRFKK